MCRCGLAMVFPPMRPCNSTAYQVSIAPDRANAIARGLRRAALLLACSSPLLGLVDWLDAESCRPLVWTTHDGRGRDLDLGAPSESVHPLQHLARTRPRW